MKALPALFFILITSILFGQSRKVKIPLTLQVATGNVENDETNLKARDTTISIPGIPLVKTMLFALPLNNFQLLMENHANKIVPDSIFKLIVKQRKIDTTDFIDCHCDNTILILLGIRPNNAMVLIPDLNNNNSFADDSVFTVPRKTPAKFLLHDLNFTNLLYCIGSNRKLLHIPVSVQLDNSAQNKPVLKVFQNVEWVGNIDLGDNQASPFYIDLASANFDFKYVGRVGITFGNELNIKYYQKSFEDFHAMGDTFSYRSNKIVVDSVSLFGEFAYVTIIPDSSIVPLHTLLAGLRGPDILDSSRLVNVSSQAKYTLVDFWASWCGPCIAQHELLLKNLQMISKSGTAITGVAIEQSANKKAALAHIRNKRIPWPNIFIDKESSQHFNFDLFHISILPTYVLLDNSSHSVVAKTNSIAEAFKIIKALVP